MSLIDDAFAALKTNLEITQTEQELAKSRHALIRDHIRARWDLRDDFLTGSYARHTKTKKLKDVDIFVVIDEDGSQADLRDGTGHTAIDELASILATRWTVHKDSNVVRIEYADEAVASYEIAPAFQNAVGFSIPNGAGWMATDPTAHAAMVAEKNIECAQRFVPFIKMIKAINREAGEPVSPSFLIEVMALDLVDPPFLTYREEIRYFLAAAADQITQDWADPAGLGPAVNADQTASGRSALAATLREWQLAVEYAIRLEEAGRERAAVDAWRVLFGSRMPSL